MCAMVSQKYHTPFCIKNCKIEHHDLVTVLCLDSSQKSDELPDLLKECIESYGRSWDRNSNVPDPLEDLRCPLLYLATAFGKAGLVKALLQDGFDPHVLNSCGETALHGAVEYIYRTGSLQTRGLKVASTLGPIKNRRKAFERILVALTDSDPKIIFVPDNNGNTVFHAVAENVWNDRESDRLGKSATFYQFCMSSMVNRVLEMEEAGQVTRTETLEGLNAQNNEGDTIFHILARDYAYGFKTMKQILKIFFPGEVPSIVNKENQTVPDIALARNRKRATQVFPEFLAKSESVITISSESDISDNDSQTPSTSRDSGPSAITNRDRPIVISDSNVPQITHTIEEEDDGSDEAITVSRETDAGSVFGDTSAPINSNVRRHDLLTVSFDSSLGKLSQMDIPSFNSLSEKSNQIISPYESVLNVPVEAEVMCASQTIQSTVNLTLEENTERNNASETGDALHAASKRPEVSDTCTNGTDNAPSDPKAPFTHKLSSDDSKVANSITKDVAIVTSPTEERIALSSVEVAVCSATVPEKSNSGPCLGKSSAAEGSCRPEAQTTQAEKNDQSDKNTIELHDSPESKSGSPDVHDKQIPLQSPVTLTSISRQDDVASKQQPSVSKVLETSRGKQAANSSQAKVTGESKARDLPNRPRKQIPESSEYMEEYTYGIMNTPVLSPRRNIDHTSVRTHHTISATSLTSASTESVHFQSFEPLDADDEASDEKSTILKCITDNSFLEFLITEGLELDACSKKGVVEVVIAQYNNKLDKVESTIPKLAAQLRETESNITQQKEKVKQLQEEIEFVKGEIVKNENLFQDFTTEQQGLNKQRKALKRKVARCERTMTKLLGKAKKPRVE